MQSLWIARAAAEARVADLRQEAEARELRLSARGHMRHLGPLRGWRSLLALGRPSRPAHSAAGGAVATFKAAPRALSHLVWLPRGGR